MKTYLLPCLCIAVAACTQPHTDSNTSQKDTSITATKDSVNKELKIDWDEALIEKYLTANAVRFYGKTQQRPAYMKETTQRNGKRYTAVRIGQSNEAQFVTTQWIYLDSVSKKIYEYDIAEDSLIAWPSENIKQ